MNDGPFAGIDAIRAADDGVDMGQPHRPSIRFAANEGMAASYNDGVAAGIEWCLQKLTTPTSPGPGGEA